MDQLFVIKLENGASLNVRASDSFGLARGDQCVFRKDFYMDIGEVVSDPRSYTGGDLPIVQRKATLKDFAQASETGARSRSALNTAENAVERLGLPMNLLNARFSMDGGLLTIQFTADGRVDFRELVKELSHVLGVRIELRQIGVRDETAMLGGIAVCGQPLCCARYLKEFNSINVRMAKDQDLSLTPATISGACGRLKCCLKYEHEGYVELARDTPRRGEYAECPSGRGKVVDRNLLTGDITIHIDGGNLVHFPKADVTVLKGERPPRREEGGRDRNNGKTDAKPGENKPVEGKPRDRRRDDRRRPEPKDPAKEPEKQ